MENINEQNIYDVIIIGGGPGGISTALYTATGGLKTLVLHNGKSGLHRAERIVNYYGVGEVRGSELYERGIASAVALGVDVKNGEVTFAEDVGGAFRVSSMCGEFTGRRLVIATGAARKRADIAELDNYEGKGVSYCAVCDRFFYRKKTVGVIGSGEFALHEYNALKATAEKVYLLTNGAQAEFGAENTVTQKIVRVVGNNGRVGGVKLEGGEVIVLDGLFVALGVAGSGEMARSLGAFTDERGAIKVDADGRTNVGGLFAVGDCTNGIKQVVKAADDGLRTGVAIVKELKNA